MNQLGQRNYVAAAKAFDEVELHMLKSAGKKGLRVFFKMQMKGAFITKVSNNATEDGNVAQKVDAQYAIVNAFGFGGQNVVAVLSRVDE